MRIKLGRLERHVNVFIVCEDGDEDDRGTSATKVLLVGARQPPRTVFCLDVALSVPLSRGTSRILIYECNAFSGISALAEERGARRPCCRR